MMKRYLKYLLCFMVSVLWLCGIIGGDVQAGTTNTASINDELPKIEVGESHMAYIDINGDLYCWGYNVHGQVGNAGTDNVGKPVKVLSNVKSVSLGGYHTAAITVDGDLYCWGYNGQGQVGNGSTEDQLTPVKVLENVASVYLKQHCSAAITTNGDLYCWGYNGQGQVGNGSTEDQTTPVKVLENVSKVVKEISNTAAITTNGDLYCWGWDYFGLTGDGSYSESTSSSQTTPLKAFSNVKDVAFGTYHTIVLTTDGTVYCWGGNSYGQVGNGVSEYRTPSKVKVLDNVKSIYAGDYNSAALTESGELYCWGGNTSGTVGNGGAEDQTTPQRIMTGVKSFSVSAYHCAAVTTADKLYCWGDNDYGQVGNGSTKNQTTPVEVLEDVSFVMTSRNNTAALLSNNDLYCWGFNYYKQIGNDTNIDRVTPLKIQVRDCDFTYTIESDEVTITGYLGSDADVVIPDTLEDYPVVAIAEEAFLSCTGIQTITFPDSLRKVGNHAFAGCTALKAFCVSVGNQTYTTEDGVLFSKDRTRLIVFPGGKGGEEEEEGSYEVPEGVTEIASYAFEGCLALSFITFPESVETLGNDIFSGTESLHQIYFEGEPPAFSDYTLEGSRITIVYYSFVYHTEWQEISDNDYGGTSNPSWLRSDIWRFSNNYFSADRPDGMEKAGNKYVMTQADIQRYTATLGPVDYMIFSRKRARDWRGSCYGMSTWVCLNYAKIRTYEDIEKITGMQDGATCLYEWGNLTEVKSAVNFYHMQQYLPYTLARANEFMELPQKSQLAQLDKMAEKESPFTISFHLYRNGGGLGGHTVVGYGREQGSYTITTVTTSKLFQATYTYPYRVKIYDPTVPDGGEDYYLYYDLENDVWTIPAWNILSLSNDAKYLGLDNAALDLLSDEENEWNLIDYTTGERENIIQVLFGLITDNTDYQLTADDKKYTVSNGQVESEDSEALFRVLPEFASTLNGDTASAQTTALLPESENGYQITTQEDSMNFALCTQNYYLEVKADSPGTISFSVSGDVAVNLEKEADWHISITANDGYNSTKWNTVEADGRGSGNIEMKQNDMGVLVEGIQNGELEISVSNKDVSEEISVSPEQSSVLIKESDGKPAAYEDSNQDGTYDSKLSDKNAVVPSKTNNVITASDKTKTTASKAQSFVIGAKAKENAKLSYASNSKSVTVNQSGKVTIKKNFVGKATITITSAETDSYKKTTKKITVTVNPKGTKLSGVSSKASKKMTVKWKKNKAVNGYQIQYSNSPTFKMATKTVTVKKSGTVSKSISKLKKGKVYYVRIRTYKKVSGKTYYSAWSGKKKVRIK